MRRPLLVLCVVLTAVHAWGEQENRINVAVNDLTPKGVDKSSAEIISDRIRSELMNTGLFRVMERTEMKSILQEVDFQRSDVCDVNSCIVEMGQLLGVDRMVAGSIGKIGSIFTLSLRIINVATGEILFNVDEDCPCPIEDLLSISAKNAVSRLAQSVGEDAAVRALRKKKADLHIAADRDSADIYIDNKKIDETTPATLRGIQAGPHIVSVRKGEYFASENINLVPDDLKSLNLIMSKGKGSVKVFSSPDGADVVIDNVVKGRTPLKIDDIPVGEHEVIVSRDQYLPAKEKIVVTVDESAGLNVSLKKAAWITLQTEAPNAAILIDGEQVGRGSIASLPVPAGTIDVQIEAVGFEVFKGPVTLAPGERKTFRAKLVSRFATLSLATTPPGAMAYLDEKKLGMTPMDRQRVVPGNYALRLEMPGYETRRETVSFAKNGDFSLSYVMNLTKAYTDSVRSSKMRKKIVRQSVIGGITAVVAATGVYFNSRAESKYAQYLGDKSQDRGSYDRAWHDAHAFAIARNAVYGVAGAVGVAFAITVAIPASPRRSNGGAPHAK